MGCELQSCNYYKACQLAQEVVSSNADAVLQPHVRNQKLAELAMINLILEKVAPECEGQKDDGRTCGSAALVKDIRNMVFGTPAIEVSGKPYRPLGYKIIE